MPLQATSGAASYDAFGGGVPAVPNYIEDVFSTWLYTGNGATQTINNGIDLAGKGGMVWTKQRDGTIGNYLFDSARGFASYLQSNSTAAAATASPAFVSATSSGFSVDAGFGSAVNGSGNTYASWTFREQPKFFDVVTYTGNGGTTRTINHNLASVPGCIIIKATSTTSDWWVTHRNNGSDAVYGSLNLTDAMNPFGDPMTRFATSTEFYPRLMDSSLNTNGVTYVAYLFAHNAGGFGLSGTDNVISCGSYTGTGAEVNVTLGYEPQWILIKRSDNVSPWSTFDIMRGFSSNGTSSDARLWLNSSASEVNSPFGHPTATGFAVTGTNTDYNEAGGTYIYIAIRRGPMATPTTGTSVFKPLSATGTGSARTVDAGFPVDTFFIKDRTGLSGPTAGGGNVFYDRLRGNSNVLQTQSTDAEAVNASYTALFNSVQNGVVVGDAWSAYGYREYCFRRAPGFFDEVCYTGTGVARTVAHNLTVAPELMIIKQRNAATDWWVINYPLNGTLQLNNPYPINSPIPTNLSTGATATTFSLGTYGEVNGSGSTYVAYLFATCAGVSKVGSYTGTGTTQTINCGFTAGARFVMIKRADDTGLYTEGWYVWDSARGIVAGNDPYLLLNSTAAEVTNTDFIDTASTGFEISSTAPAAINASGGTFIFLAIA